VGCWDDPRVEEEAEELDDSVDVEEKGDLLSTWGEGRRERREGAEEEGALEGGVTWVRCEEGCGSPTAVYFERIWRTIMSVMMRAMI